MYYPIDIDKLVRRGTYGSGPHDPQIPERPPRRLRLRFAGSRRARSQARPHARPQPQRG